MSKRVSTKVIRQITNIEDQSYYSVAEDEYDCVNVLYHEGAKTERCLTVPPEYAREIADALIECAEEIEAKRIK